MDNNQPTPMSGQPSQTRVDPLAPSKLGMELEQQTSNTFQQSQDQAKKLEEAEKQRQVTEAFDKVRKLGFLTQADIDGQLKSKEEQINKAFAEIQQIKAYLKNVATPAQNSGILDDPKPVRKNPLL